MKPNNILLVRDVFKLADFGFTKFQKDEGETRIPEMPIKGVSGTYGKDFITIKISISAHNISRQVHRNSPRQHLRKVTFRSVKKPTCGHLAV